LWRIGTTPTGLPVNTASEIIDTLSAVTWISSASSSSER